MTPNEHQAALSSDIARFSRGLQMATIRSSLQRGWSPEAAFLAVPASFLLAAHYHPEWFAAVIHILIEGEEDDRPALRESADDVVNAIPITLEIAP